MDALKPRQEPFHKNYECYHWLFLAMTHWQLGQKQDAREWFDKTDNWINEHPNKDPYLSRVRAEARELMGRD